MRIRSRTLMSGRLGVAILAALSWTALPARVTFGADACLLNNFGSPPATHQDVDGTIGGACGGGSESNAYAGTFNISIDGGPATLGYCVDLNHPISGGDCEPQSQQPAYPCEVTYILNHFYPNGPVSPGLSTADEAAAVQSAIWHFTDCFNLTHADGGNSANVIARYNAIIAAATANADPSCNDPVVPHTVTVTPATAVNTLPADNSHSVTVTVLDNNDQPMANQPVTVTVSGGPSGPYMFNGVTDANGQFVVNYTNASGIAGSDSIVATTSFQVPVGLEFSNGVFQRIVLSGPPRTGSIDGSATKNWVVAQCGDHVINQDTELCDDGNLVDGDGCDSNCTPTACGNGIPTAGEACDDGNGVDGDGCDSNCTATACGNGIPTAGEVCDDGNLVSGDGCDENCTPTECGNGVKTGNEQCDDGNLTDGDGCDSNCTSTACGNGVQTTGEECDDGNAVNGDGCDTNCTTTRCGNGVPTTGEECDDGNATNGDGCDTNCTTTRCGNGVVGPGEACDDGNHENGDGCDNNCTTSGCGNGIVTAPEQCDDGNTNNGDSCEADCTLPKCGNGIVDVSLGEQCDDGNLTDGDGCSPTCQLHEICTDLIDNDNDGRIDCDDPDCDCQVFGKDPAAIVFRPTRPDHDYFKVHGRLVLQDPSSLNGKFGILLTNAGGVIYRALLQPGDLKPKGKGAAFSDKTAKSGTGIRDGLSQVKVKVKQGYVQVQVKAYSDLSEATVPLMGVQVVIGNENAFYKSEWSRRSNGWRLKLPKS